jgi:hypothetical protein
MSLIEKAYFALEELEERWQMPHRDLAYLAENGLLRLSVRLFGVQVEFGAYEENADGRSVAVPWERRAFTGMQDLQERDVFRIFRQGQVEVMHFHAPKDEYCQLIEPTRSVAVCREDLVVRREERDRVESQHKLLRSASVGSAPLQQANDYREVRMAGLVFNLGPVQAGVVAQLHRRRPPRTPGARARACWAPPAPPAPAWPMCSSHSRIGGA